MWKKFRLIDILTRFDFIYSIFLKSFIYLKINKSKGFEKFIISVYFKIKFFYTYLKIAIITNKDIWNNIIIIIVNKLIIPKLLGQKRNKIIDKI